jgi:hypothetical protein
MAQRTVKLNSYTTVHVPRVHLQFKMLHKLNEFVIKAAVSVKALEVSVMNFVSFQVV